MQGGGFEIGNRSKSKERLQTVQNLYVFGFEGLFFLKTYLGESRESVSCFIDFTLTIVDLEVILKEFLGPLNLPRA